MSFHLVLSRYMIDSSLLHHCLILVSSCLMIHRLLIVSSISHHCVLIISSLFPHLIIFPIVSSFFHHSVIILRIIQHTPKGTYPRPPTNSLCFGIPFIWWGFMGYAPQTRRSDDRGRPALASASQALHAKAPLSKTPFL